MADQASTTTVGSRHGHLPEGAPLSAELVQGDVRVRFAEGTVTLPADWLRDVCPCADCCIVQTDERRWQPWSDGVRAEAASVDVVHDVLEVTWRCGHRSAYDAATFAAIESALHRGEHAAELWSAGHELTRFEHDDIVADDITRRHLFEVFLRDGAVVVTGAPRRSGACADLLTALGIPLRELAHGRVFDVTVDPEGYNVAYTAEAIPPHNDNAQCSHPPSGQVLAMLVNETSGGESIVVDGWSVLDRLAEHDPAAVDVLCRVAVGFRQYSADAEGFTRMPIAARDVDGRICHLRFSNQLRQPLPFDHPDLAAWYDAYRRLGRMVTDPARQVRFRLGAGDMLMVNGLRVLHGRTAFVPDGRRHLQDVYFEVDDVIGNLARLTGAATNAMVWS
ncbi:MAG: TauD/TfdA family dioxygenase [Acidimicrobiia bacterium]|nr:TauD/TfdA family dioxygenase [Acidimicrobiia bacterium]